MKNYSLKISKKYFLKKISIFLLLSFSGINIFADEIINKKINSLEDNIKKVEKNIIDLEVQKKLFETEKKRLENDLNTQIDLTIKNHLLTSEANIKKDLEERINRNTEGVTDWKYWREFSKVLIALLGAGSILGIIQIYKNIDKLAKEKIDEKLGNIFEDKKDTFLKLIKENDTETLLKKEKNL